MSPFGAFENYCQIDVKTDPKGQNSNFKMQIVCMLVATS